MARIKDIVEVPEEVEVDAVDTQESEEEENQQEILPVTDDGIENGSGIVLDEAIVEKTEGSPFGVWSSETAAKKGLKVLLYGPPGSGKTRMAATFPRPLFLDVENGMRTTLRVKPVLRYPSDPKEEIVSLNQVFDFYKLVKRAEAPDFETIVIDSLYALQVLVMNHVVSKYTQANRQYDDQFTQADYGKANRDLLKIIRLFLSLPYHIIFTTGETPRTYPEQQVFPKLKGNEVWPDLRHLIEMIGYCHVIKGKEGISEHVVSFHLSPTHIAKDRLNIPERVVPNDYESLAKYMNAES